jgi:radical SAM/Cys-rich protein
MNEFEEKIADFGVASLSAQGIDIIQVNLGLRCNQSCEHCHLECGPDRTENMEWPVMEKIVEVAGGIRPRVVDLTGGAPELHPHLREFISALRRAGHDVQVRTNLTALTEPGLSGMPEFYRDNRVTLVASMPCYLEENVRAQRGNGAYEKSIGVSQHLNRLGYARTPGLELDLVYNPGGAFLPASQDSLEADYKRELGRRFGISFSRLYTITNIPIGRFRYYLQRENKEQEYLRLLRNSFNPGTVEKLMCRHQVSIGWDGTIYDCDFNLALGLAVNHGAPDHLRVFDAGALANRRIVTGAHCFTCTAGCGSSCRGALT